MVKRIAPPVAGLILFALALGANSAYAVDACKNRGELDVLYCDANGDMVADSPADPKKWKNPSTIVFTYTPVEDPAVYENIFKPFTTYLGQCLNKKVVFYQVQSNAAEIEAMRSGRLHVGVLRADVGIDSGCRSSHRVGRNSLLGPKPQRRFVVIERLDHLHVVQIAPGVREPVERHR